MAKAVKPDAPSKSETLESPSESAGAIDYCIDGASIKVTWMRFPPRDTAGTIERIHSDAVIFLLPGWGYTESATSTAAVSQAFADVSGNVVYALDTYTERIAPYVAHREAQAARKFIEAVPAARRVLVGQSQGGWAAMCIAASCADITGLVLVDSMGMVTRTLGQFLVDYVKENVNSTFLVGYSAEPHYDVNNLRAVNARYLKEGIGEIARQIRLAGGVLSYAARLSKEVRGMVVQNPCARELTLPIVIINGEQDKLSRPGRIIPVEHPSENGSSYIASLKERERYLRNRVFPRSPYIRMIVARKLGYHGLVAFRPLEVARTSLYLLERWERANTDLLR